MIPPEEQNYIISEVEKNIDYCLKESGFDSSVKEPGHSFGEKIEEILVKKLISINSKKFSIPLKDNRKSKQTRNMEDFIWKPTKDLINIKIGYNKKNGFPNMVSFNRLLDKFHKDEIDSYYILIISILENLKTNLYFFNLYDYLDCVYYNYGTGQVMLDEKKFFKNYSSNKYFNTTKKDVMIKLKELDNEAFEKHITLKRKQHLKRQEIFNDYC